MIGINPVLATPHASGHFHAVRFYDTSKALCRIVASFLGDGLAVAQPALIVATPEHCRGIMDELRARHLDVDRLLADDQLVMLDARSMMSTFMVDGLPNAERFMGAAASVFERIRRTCSGHAVRAYGEMVDLLWKDGHDVAAIQLEMLWNRLAQTRDFSLLCGYAMGNFYKDACVVDICREHSHVIGTDGTPVIANAGSLTVGSVPHTV